MQGHFQDLLAVVIGIVEDVLYVIILVVEDELVSLAYDVLRQTEKAPTGASFGFLGGIVLQVYIFVVYLLTSFSPSQLITNLSFNRHDCTKKLSATGR